MTIRECINRLDANKPNTYTTADKLAWLSKIDGDVYKTIIQTHHTDIDPETGQETVIEYDGYTEDTDLDTVLLVEPPYDELYLRYLEGQIDYANGEYGKYNNSISAYNAQFMAYEQWYNRTHMPKGKHIRFF
ncbi:MAG: hypothetical protein IKD75_10820 [Prevotella sp.]|nr:hypothetical protein [Prevotella sp.]